jgi:excisionase family DNA binding protein
MPRNPNLPTTKRVAYTTGEVATMLGRDRTTVWRWLKRGVLREVRVPGGRRLVTAASLEKLLAAESNR